MLAHTQKQNTKLIGSLVALTLLVLPSLAHTQEASEASEEKNDNAIGYTIKIDGGYQYADFKGLRGSTWSVLFGLPFHQSNDVRAYLEAGLNESKGDQAGLPSTRLVVGSRIAWLWDKTSLHLDGHFGYGDRSTTASGTMIEVASLTRAWPPTTTCSSTKKTVGKPLSDCSCRARCTGQQRPAKTASTSML